MNHFLSWIPILFVAATSFAACSSDNGGSEDCQGDRCDTVPELALCTAIRGNGELISSHFAGLARVVEHYGMVDAAAGGSSASITIFMIESMQGNPAVSDCKNCSEDEVNARAALLLKSFPGYVQHLGTTPEAAIVGNAMPIIQRIQAEGIEVLLDSDAPAGISALIAVLETREFQDLINPELIPLLQSSPNPEKHARDILAGIQGLGSFSPDVDDKVFIRPSLISFPAVADKLGRVADFYAGYGPSDPMAMENFMSSCATPGRGKNWFEVSTLPAGNGKTCGEAFDEMVGTYRAALAQNPDAFDHRIDEDIGGKIPALVSTSVMDGPTATSFTKARQDYNTDPESYTFESRFEDITFGYWGQEKDLLTVAANKNAYDDLKTKKFSSLGSAKWRHALALSPAEPGLSRAIALPDGRISAGGWSDLHPVLALRNLGCEKVVYLTRTGEDSGFAQGIASVLGMDKASKDALYSLDADSAFALSLAESDATMCTNWDAFKGTDLLAIAQDAYNAPMTSDNEFFTKGERAYDNLNKVKLRGCSLGVAKPAAE